MTDAILQIELNPKEQAMAQEVTALVNAPLIPAILTAEQDAEAFAFLSRLKALEKAVHALWDDDIEMANKLHKSLTSKRKRFLDAIGNTFRLIDAKRSQYLERLEREKQERERIEREKAQAIQQAELLAEAATLERTGDTLGAECVLAEAMNAPAPVVALASSAPVYEGGYNRALPWQVEIIDPSKLKKEYWCPDLDSVTALVRKKGKLAENILGVGSVRIWQGRKTIIKG